MIIEYTGRQFVLTEKYKSQAEADLTCIARLVGSAASAHVILTVDKYRMIAEVTVVDGRESLVAVCEAVEMKTALHDAMAKIEQQAIRHRQKTTKGMRHPRMAGSRTIVEPKMPPGVPRPAYEFSGQLPTGR